LRDRTRPAVGGRKPIGLPPITADPMLTKMTRAFRWAPAQPRVCLVAQADSLGCRDGAEPPRPTLDGLTETAPVWAHLTAIALGHMGLRRERPEP